MIKGEILSIIQKSFPLVQKPFLDIASKFGISEDEVLKILQEEKANKIIRQTSAIFDTKRLGYESSLVAFEVAKEDIDDAVKVINSHPGVSHNYERNHSFNIWFTLAVQPNSKFGLNKTVEILAKLTKAKAFIALPTLKMFKIAVKLDTANSDKIKEKVAKRKFKEIELTPKYLEVIKKVQHDIEIVSEPFKNIVDELNLSYDEFFSILEELKEAGVMRRFASILNHRKAGFNANAMVVWDIDEKQGEKIGKNAAEFSAVSHCYLRPKYPNWPFNLFTMIHGKTKEETDGKIAEIANEISHRSKMHLYSSREFKKVRIVYFIDSFTEWENSIKV